MLPGRLQTGGPARARPNKHESAGCGCTVALQCSSAPAEVIRVVLHEEGQVLLCLSLYLHATAGIRCAPLNVGTLLLHTSLALHARTVLLHQGLHIGVPPVQK